MPYPNMPTRVPSNAHKVHVQRVKSIRKLLLLSTTWDQSKSYRAGLSISEKFESPDLFNHCIVKLNKNDAIVRLKFAEFQAV